jgi:hypothetical protein
VYSAIAFNAVMLTILTLILKNIVPISEFLIFTLLVPIYYLWNWESQARAINRLMDM